MALRTSLLLDISALNVRFGGQREHSREREESSISRKILSNFHQNLPLRHYFSSTFWASKLPSVPPFLPDTLPFLNTPPGMESRCGTGKRRDCLPGYKERGGELWGAWGENVGTTLKFVWMPLSTIWCNVQFGTWHFKWKLCSPDERDLGLVELEGGVVLEALFNSLDKQPSGSLLSRHPSTPCAFFQ